MARKKVICLACNHVYFSNGRSNMYVQSCSNCTKRFSDAFALRVLKNMGYCKRSHKFDGINK